MSLKWMNTVKNSADKSNARKYLALLALADYANEEGECWPSISSIAQWIGSSPKQARRHIKSLIDDGWIIIIRKGGGKYTNIDGSVRGIPNRYKLIDPSHAREGIPEETSSSASPVLTSPDKPHPSHNDAMPSREAPMPSHNDAMPSREEGGNPSVKTIIKNHQEEPKDSLTHREKQKMQGELEIYVSEISGLAIPPRKTQRDRKAAKIRWWDPLWEMLELCGWDLPLAKQGILRTMQEMDQGNLTFDAPQSMIKIFRSLVAKAKRGVLRPKTEPRGLQGGREFLRGGSP